jgi:virginiamycin B lyase
LLRTVRVGCILAAALAAGLLAACGKGTPITSGPTATPSPNPPKVTEEFPIATANSRPMGITLGPITGSLWFTEFAGNNVGELDTTATISEFHITPNHNTEPVGIAAGPNSLLWFTESNNHTIGQIAVVSGQPTITQFTMPNTKARPVGIALGSDGNMWITDRGTNAIWRVTQLGAFTSFPLNGNAQPLGITNGPDGALWFTEPGTNKIGRLNITGSSLTEYGIPTGNSDPVSILSANDNALWFTEQHSIKLGRMTVQGTVTNEYSLAPAKQPDAVLQGVDGNFYFTDTAGSAIGRFLTAGNVGQIALFPTKTANAGPTAVSIGPDNQLYFTETNVNKIGQFKYF